MVQRGNDLFVAVGHVVGGNSDQIIDDAAFEIGAPRVEFVHLGFGVHVLLDEPFESDAQRLHGELREIIGLLGRLVERDGGRLQDTFVEKARLVHRLFLFFADDLGRDLDEQ